MKKIKNKMLIYKANTKTMKMKMRKNYKKNQTIQNKNNRNTQKNSTFKKWKLFWINKNKKIYRKIRKLKKNLEVNTNLTTKILEKEKVRTGFNLVEEMIMMI